jgi:orotidine-5'-phosphate decarboxylase
MPDLAAHPFWGLALEMGTAEHAGKTLIGICQSGNKGKYVRWIDFSQAPMQLHLRTAIARPPENHQGAPDMSKDRLIVAMDVPNVLDGLELAKTLGDSVSFYKIGLGMLTGGGLALANELKQEHGKRIFLDMKFFDIGATVEAAVRGVAQFGLDFLTVHGDPHVVRAARIGAGGSDMKILAVTILTSLDRDDLDASCIKAGAVADLVQERAGIALSNGADGVIASPQEAALIRALPEAEGKLIVTPGVRPVGAALGDQKRVQTPAQAILNGADHVVVGRPIWQAQDPRKAALDIQAELASV